MKRYFSGWSGATIICNFPSSISLQKEAFHFVAQFLKKFDFLVDIIEQSNSNPQLFSAHSQISIENLFLFIPVCLSAQAVLPDTKNGSQILHIARFFHKMPKSTNFLLKPKIEIIVDPQQLEQLSFHGQIENYIKNVLKVVWL